MEQARHFEGANTSPKYVVMNLFRQLICTSTFYTARVARTSSSITSCTHTSCRCVSQVEAAQHAVARTRLAPRVEIPFAWALVQAASWLRLQRLMALERLLWPKPLQCAFAHAKQAMGLHWEWQHFERLRCWNPGARQSVLQNAARIVLHPLHSTRRTVSVRSRLDVWRIQV